jgi:hypothetical protein
VLSVASQRRYPVGSLSGRVAFVSRVQRTAGGFFAPAAHVAGDGGPVRLVLERVADVAVGGERVAPLDALLDDSDGDPVLCCADLGVLGDRLLEVAPCLRFGV